MKFVIVESPSKAKTIEKYLGKGYMVSASKGHLVDLPKSELGIDLENKFQPKYVVTKKATLKNLKTSFSKADELILAVDPDREGEAIGWHIAKQLGVLSKSSKGNKKVIPVTRIVFTEITKSAITEAIKHPQKINMDLVNAQQARRLLDRIVGYKLSPLLWKKIRYGLSAGRVQSVAVKLIVDKEIERNNFNAEEYWNIYAYTQEKKHSIMPKIEYFLKDETFAESKGIKLELDTLNNKKIKITSKTESEKIVNECKNNKWIVEDIQIKDVKRSPKPAFTTSTLQQYCANKFNLTANQTMRIAQTLYEAGHISYMRTDSTNLSKQAIENIRSLILKNYGNNALPEKPRFYRSGSKLAQGAHEAIRPTKVEKSVKSLRLNGREAMLYNAIRNRTIASQMQDAKVRLTKVVVKTGNYRYKLTGQKILFASFLDFLQEQSSEQILPELKVGQELFLLKISAKQSFTKPPARYSEASLIKELEAKGIGRPSTYAPIISTIQARKYVEKENRYFFPTDTGYVVTKLLQNHFPEIVDVDFTAELEDKLDDIAEGKVQWQQMLSDFYQPFEKNLLLQDKKINKDDYIVLGESKYKCPICKSKMIIKLGKYGRFNSCSRFPDCKGMRGVDGESEAEIAKKANSKEFLQLYNPAPTTKEGKQFNLKKGPFGIYWAHPDYPKVKENKPLEYNKAIFKKIYGISPKSKDGKKMILRNGRFGEFWAHPDYPNKKEIKKIDKKKVKEAKKALGIL